LRLTRVCTGKCWRDSLRPGSCGTRKALVQSMLSCIFPAAQPFLRVFPTELISGAASSSTEPRGSKGAQAAWTISCNRCATLKGLPHGRRGRNLRHCIAMCPRLPPALMPGLLLGILYLLMPPVTAVCCFPVVSRYSGSLALTSTAQCPLDGHVSLTVSLLRAVSACCQVLRMMSSQRMAIWPPVAVMSSFTEPPFGK